MNNRLNTALALLWFFCCLAIAITLTSDRATHAQRQIAHKDFMQWEQYRKWQEQENKQIPNVPMPEIMLDF